MTNKKFTQSKVFEFLPNEDITVKEILELVELVRIGVSGEIVDKASPELKKHFTEIKK
jgi:hypothetical protein